MQKPRKKLAEYIILNKQKFTKLDIQKAKQYLFDVEANATTIRS